MSGVPVLLPQPRNPLGWTWQAGRLDRRPAVSSTISSAGSGRSGRHRNL